MPPPVAPDLLLLCPVLNSLPFGPFIIVFIVFLPCHSILTTVRVPCSALPVWLPTFTFVLRSYEIYPELEELFTERKEAFIEDLAEHYGQEIPFIYEHCPDM